MTGDSPFLYDAATDSLYVKVRPGPSVDNTVDDARDLVVDLDANGEVVGYDIQHASRHPDVIAEALTALRSAQGHSKAA
ncbi:MAG TPA: DUF2283 domain-containing protein [Azospirillum sp.]|nr:DUF2283 domain-containing protein [Azospirillum sp.]